MRNLFFVVFAVLAVSACSEDDHRIDISYTGEQLGSIQVPLGGIGTGSMVLNGCGGLTEFDLLGDSLHETEDDLLSFFALHISTDDSKPVVRLLERDCMNENEASSAENMLQQIGVQGFSEAIFHNAYPVVNIDLLDESVPLEVTMNAWSPLIPVDVLNSSLPAAVIEWDLFNPGRKNMAYSIMFMMENPLKPALQGDTSNSERLAISTHSANGWKGITFSNYQGEPEGAGSGALRIMSPGQSNLSVVSYDSRADAAEHIKREFLTDGTLMNHSDDNSHIGNEPGVYAIHISGILQPGESVNIPFLFSWFRPWNSMEGYSNKCPEVDDPEEKAATTIVEGTGRKAETIVAELAEVENGINRFVETADKEVAKREMIIEKEKEAKVTEKTGKRETAGQAEEIAGMVDMESAENEYLYFQRFTDIDHLSGYLEKEFEKLRKKTLQFSRAIITSTVPPEVVDTMMIDLTVAIDKQIDLKHFILNPMDEVHRDSRSNNTAPTLYDVDEKKVEAWNSRGSDAVLSMRGWDSYREITGYSYEREIQVMEISPAIDVLPVRCFWSTSTGWGTINISRAAIVLECIHGSLDLKELILEGRSFFVFREFVPSQDAFTSYSDEALRIEFPMGLSLKGGAAFRMEIP